MTMTRELSFPLQAKGIKNGRPQGYVGVIDDGGSYFELGGKIEKEGE